eukprot:CAMPEP_0172180196 /NCGR_PEP_ID=MMETSP1050-20130122/17072_1 /TAXON_ID=233186 /ORGANISM="Cryptomonas curvata, Strain CCAP979/52" /LENGTH=125 /DNA_ID=CAMNT_0012853229 /DNA_START=371 /DNA_END=747 /DNA_ORIENTATION=-
MKALSALTPHRPSNTSLSFPNRVDPAISSPRLRRPPACRRTSPGATPPPPNLQGAAPPRTAEDNTTNIRSKGQKQESQRRSDAARSGRGLAQDAAAAIGGALDEEAGRVFRSQVAAALGAGRAVW